MDSSITILEKREHGVRAARILVVEDERIVAMSLRKQLSKLGYEIVGHAPSGTEAIQKAGELRPDVVLMDIHLEGAMDGVAAARQIRPLSNPRRLPDGVLQQRDLGEGQGHRTVRLHP